jgi:alpha,alpha-trehalase
MYESCRAYIDDYWKKITCFHPRDNKTRIGLPHHFISPNDTFFKDDQFYWDTYFICEGLLARGEVHLVKGIVENFLFLFRKYGVIPLRNQLYNLGISQPPFLSSLVWSVYERTNDKVWLTEMVFFLEEELLQYWMDGGVVGKHLLAMGLSRYCDHEITHVTAEHESGWDMTSRFNEHCLHFAPVDLNSLLYKYEIDLAKMFEELDDQRKAKEYYIAATKRKELVTRYCWHEEVGFFFDYNHYTKTQSSFFSLAGFYPLWTGLASDEQAKRMRDQLSVFECEGGLANTQSHNLSEEFKQWDYPNGWPNQQYIVIFGLTKYGFVDDAKRLAKKWLDLNNVVFNKTGLMWEKYDVVALSKGKCARYETQSGFAWTNAVFILLVDFLDET